MESFRNRLHKFKKFFLCKKIITKPKINKLLIYDESRSVEFKKIIKNRNASVLSIRGERLNLYVLVKSILKNFKIIFSLSKLKQSYVLSFIKEVDPKVIITYIDNDPFFYTLKKYFPKKIFISVQNGYRFYKQDLFCTLQEKKMKNLSCDYIFCFNKDVAKHYKKYIKCKTLAVGSVKNNSVKKKINKNKNMCLFISSYGISNLSLEKKLLPKVIDFCKDFSLELYVLARSYSQEEKEFYFSLNKKIKFLEKKKYFEYAYSITDRSSLAITLNNTLGYESLSRKNKTIFFNINDRELNCNSYKKFGWPSRNTKNGPFWSNRMVGENVYKLLKKIHLINSENWKKIFKKYNTIEYLDNSLLLKVIKKNIS